jgi:alpha/beta superfamily hydrolase
MKMAILNFLLENWDSVLVVIGFIALVVVLIKRGETKILNNILYKLVTQAEREFGAGTGELKYAAVSDWVYERLPAILKFLFTSKDIDKMIESTLEMAKQKWERNENLKMYINNEEKIPLEVKTE